MATHDVARTRKPKLDWRLASPPRFDERRFPCAPPFKTEYDAAVKRGQEVMAGARIVVCGLARDVERELPGFVARIDVLMTRVADLRVIVYENDSVDRTTGILREWEDAEPHVHLLSERRGDPRWGPERDRARTEQLAGYRNHCREIALERYGDFDFVIVTDLDLDGWSTQGIANTFGHHGWDVVGANGLTFRGGRAFYYDSWAFRSLGHPDAHPDRSVNLMVFPTGAPFLRVASCFGGMAIYRMEAIRSASYGGEDCEHVVLHRRLADAGFDRVFLNPSMLLRYPDFSRGIAGGRDYPRWWKRHRSGRYGEPDPGD